MVSLNSKNVAVIGGSRSVGRRIVEAAVESGAHVLAVARHEAALRQLAEDVPGIDILALDATAEDAPSKVFDVLAPDVLVLCAGAFPPAAPLQQQSWTDFAVNWESDVKMAFHFCKAALSRPLRAGTSVVLISSGAALAGSPNTGGYAGAKRTQLFIADYSQKESDRLGLGLRFISLVPRMMPDTDIGRQAVAGYARMHGVSESDFIRRMPGIASPADVATGILTLLEDPDRSKGKVFVVSTQGLERVP